MRHQNEFWGITLLLNFFSLTLKGWSTDGRLSVCAIRAPKAVAVTLSSGGEGNVNLDALFDADEQAIS
jgi:hypothetical protein